jgi:lipopolysaccharide export system permease protein
MLNKYLAGLFFKYFLVIMSALVLFFVGFDYLQSIRALPSSANLHILYIFYKSYYAFDILLPISIVFSIVATKIHLLRTNELIGIYSLGYRKENVIKPIFFVSVIIFVLYIFTHTTSAVYSYENAINVKKNRLFSTSTQNLFFKFDKFYIYIKRLYPLQKKAVGIRIFEIENKELKKIIKAKKAFFKGDAWNIINAEVIVKKGNKISIAEKKVVKVLRGFKPKILDTIYEGKGAFTIFDAIYALKLLKAQNINLKKIRASLYYQTIYPLFALFLLVIIFYFVPVSQRMTNVAIFSFFAILFSLVIWGFLFLLAKLSMVGIVNPEVAILFPNILLAFASFFVFKKF